MTKLARGNAVKRFAFCTARSARNLVHKIVHLVREDAGLELKVGS